MIIDIITIFPKFFDYFFEHSIIKRAIEKNKIIFKVHDLRKYSNNKHNQVDDSPYGGGAGMLLKFPPFYDCLKKIKKKFSKVVLLSPQGTLLNQKIAFKYANEIKHLIILSGNYEGIDARILNYIDLEISIGDYVLTGGEIATIVLIDVLVRLLPGVINSESYLEDSHQKDLLKYPQYTKPEIYQNQKVPEILLSGHHKNIKDWRDIQSLKNTFLKRPDILKKINLTEKQKKILSEIKKKLKEG
ncbi:MAG: tRNA (guanosine(37)-N1)-methyltransferase TrmD [Candidatus Phytoplasma pyri]